jgi:cobalt/nickel transport protein
MNARTFPFTLAALAVALVLACFLSPHASENPDGLEKFAENFGVEAAEIPAWKQSPLPDYSTPFVSSESLSGPVAGAIGTLIMFGALFGLGKLIAARNRAQSETACAP